MDFSYHAMKRGRSSTPAGIATGDHKASNVGKEEGIVRD
jgi:hypothetical protein